MIILLSGSLGKKFFERGFFERLVGSDGKHFFFRLTWHLGRIPLESGRNLSLFVGGDQPRTLFCIIVDPHRRSINTSGGNTNSMCFGNRVWQGPSFSSWGLMMRLMMILMLWWCWVFWRVCSLSDKLKRERKLWVWSGEIQGNANRWKRKKFLGGSNYERIGKRVDDRWFFCIQIAFPSKQGYPDSFLLRVLFYKSPLSAGIREG